MTTECSWPTQRSRFIRDRPSGSLPIPCMPHKPRSDKMYLVACPVSRTGDRWICCFSCSIAYVNVVVRCNDLDALLYFCSRHDFRRVGMAGAVQRLLTHCSDIPGWWRRFVVAWLVGCFSQYGNTNTECWIFCCRVMIISWPYALKRM